MRSLVLWRAFTPASRHGVSSQLSYVTNAELLQNSGHAVRASSDMARSSRSTTTRAIYSGNFGSSFFAYFESGFFSYFALYFYTFYLYALVETSLCGLNPLCLLNH